VEGEYVVKSLVLLAATASLALHAVGSRPVAPTDRRLTDTRDPNREPPTHPGGRVSVAPAGRPAATTGARRQGCAPVEQAIAHLVGAWPLHRWRGMVLCVRDVYRATEPAGLPVLGQHGYGVGVLAVIQRRTR
jgi:hypothetical protein